MSKNHILNPLFAAALALLLLNDFVLKSAFSNFLTGKLSDLAGIVVLALFLTAFFPKRKPAVYAFVILFFTFWKSPASEGVIAFLNAQFSAGYIRVVDFTDLFCLLVLVPLYRFEPREGIRPNSLKLAFAPLAALTLFALVATSRAQPEQYGYVYVGKEIPFKSSKQDFLDLLTAHEVQYKMTYKYEFKGDSIENYELQKFLVNSDTIYSALISIKERKKDKLTLTLHNFHMTEKGSPIQLPDYSKQDSVIESYKKRVIGYFESYNQN